MSSGRSRTRRRAAELQFVPGSTRAKRLSVGALAALTAGPGAALSEASASSDATPSGEAPTTTEHTVAVTPASGARHVRALQLALGVRADGVFGHHTRAAVHDFQARHGLRRDGVVGAHTTAALRRSLVHGAVIAAPDKAPGSLPTHGPRVTVAHHQRARTATQVGGAMYENSSGGTATDVSAVPPSATRPPHTHPVETVAAPVTIPSAPATDAPSAAHSPAVQPMIHTTHSAPGTVRVSDTGGSLAQANAPTRSGSSTATGSSPGATGSSPSTSTGVAAVVAAGDRIARLPYRYGGGHGSFNDNAYDCSGSVSYALHGAGLISSPEASTGLESYGAPGPGKHITVYANSGHAFMTVDGRRFDTAAMGQTGSRWTSQPRSTAGYVVRHPAGY